MSGCVPVSLSHIHLWRTRLPVRANRLVQVPFIELRLHAVCENTLRLFGRNAVGDRIGRHKASCLLSQRRARRLTRRCIVRKQCRNSKHKHSNGSNRCHPKSSLAQREALHGRSCSLILQVFLSPFWSEHAEHLAIRAPVGGRYSVRSVGVGSRAEELRQCGLLLNGSGAVHVALQK